MRSYVEKFSKLEGSDSKIRAAWEAGNESLKVNMGEDYYFLDDSQLGTAMVTDESAVDAIRNTITREFGSIDGRTLTALAKSVASGTYFTEIGKEAPKPTPRPDVEKANSRIVEIHNAEKDKAAIEAEKTAKAKRIGRGNPVFAKLMPGSLDGKFMGKTGKFAIEYKNDTNVAQILNSQVKGLADYVDEQLGNETYEGNQQRIFVSRELQKEDTNVCVIMYHGIDGAQNREIAAAVRSAVRDAIPCSVALKMTDTYSVLNTELRNAEANYAVSGFDVSKYAPQSSHIQKLQREPVTLNMRLAPQYEYATERCASFG